jgi:hypothetical protein
MSGPLLDHIFWTDARSGERAESSALQSFLEGGIASGLPVIRQESQWGHKSVAKVESMGYPPTDRTVYGSRNRDDAGPL